MHIRRVKLVLVLFVVVCVAGSLPAWAQSASSGTVAGVVTDPSGAVVGGAAVTLTDRATNIARTTTSNATGHYFFADVPPGHYNLAVSKAGFSTTKTEDQEVLVGASLTVNLSLQIGGANVVVEVSAVGNELQTMNATVGNTVDSLAIDNLPSLGRDISTFVELQPGVGPDGAVAGAVLDQSYFSLDGGNNSNDMDGSMNVYTASMAGDPTGGVATQNDLGAGVGGPTGVIPTPQDSVEEFKVNTAGQTADFNSSAGAEVKIVTKRGTNAWHGTGYEYYKDNNWSSNSWQNNFNGVPIPSFHYNRYGGAVGGPIIPKEILGGKTYFFVNYEAFNFPQSETIFRNVPSPNLRLGLITDPVTGAVYDLKTVDPLGIGISPTVQELWNKYEPQSNAACTQSLCDGVNVLGFSGNVGIPTTSKFLATRLDHDFSAKWHFMSTFHFFKLRSATTDQVDIGGFFPGDTLGTPTSLSSNPQQAFMWVGALTTNISTNTTNDFHYSFLRNWWAFDRAGDTPQLPGLGGALEFFSGQLSGETQDLGPYNVNTQNTRTRFWDGHDQMFRDDVSNLRGNHLLQFGGTYQHNFNWHQRTDNGGGINYAPVYELGLGSSGSGLASDLPLCAPNPKTGSPDISNCGALTAAAMGIVSISQIAYTRSGTNLALNSPLTPASDRDTIPYYNVYFSDTWHMKPTFTLTYGLGWTLEMPPVEATGEQDVLVDQSNEPISAVSYLTNRKRSALAGQVYNPEIGFALVGNTANGEKYPYNPFYGEFSPRVAAAWSPHFDTDSLAGKIFGHEDTVIRGGYGRVYGRLNGVDQVLVPLLGIGPIQPVQCLNNLAIAPAAPGGGACVSGAAVGTPSTAFRIGVNGLNAPLPTGAPTLPQPDYPGINAQEGSASEALDPNFRPNVVDSFNLTVQRQLTHRVTLEFGYIGRRITHEYQPINLNAVPYMMTMGGQQFAQAYKNVVLQYCGGIAGLAGGGCAKTAGAVTPQPFFETALAGTGYCAPGTCTATVVKNEGANLANAQVWSLWSDLDGGAGCPASGCTGPSGAGDAFNFPHTMMNTAATPQMSSGVAVNTSIGYGNYNAGFASLKMADWRGLTAQSNFTWSKALGTGAVVQASSEITPDDPFNLGTMYGYQDFNRKFVYNFFLVYQPPFFKGQSGFLGRVLGGWSLGSVFTAGTGSPIEILTTTGAGQEYGAGDNVNFFGNENAIQIAPIKSGHAYYNEPSNALPVNIFSNGPAAVSDFRNPILGLDNKDGGNGNFIGLPYWNMDFSVKKAIRVAESFSLELQGVFANIFNHNQWLDPVGANAMGLFNPAGFGALPGSAQEQPGGDRQIEVGLRVRF
ncbi:MAG: carboxypeptidase-like regulatory domain-containing protein [Candidatus Sulfotelmatobacter sp.]